MGIYSHWPYFGLRILQRYGFFFFFWGKTELVGTAILYVRVDVDCLN